MKDENTVNYIIKAAEFKSIKEDIDLSKISDLRFYIRKVEAISESTYSHQKIMRKEAKTILIRLEQLYPEYFI